MVFGMACLASSEAYAVAIGMPEQTGRIGFAIGFANLSVKDPSGDTDAEWVVRPLNLIYTDKAFDSYRYWAEGFYQDAVLSPSTSSIGQEVKQLGIKASLQTEVATHVIGTSWLGAGLQLSYDRYENRHTIDSAGFLAQTYPDRSGLEPALLLNYILEMNIVGWDVAGKVEKSIPLGDATSEFTLSVGLLFSF